MRIVLDENVHHGFRKILVGHEVYTVQYLGWSGVRNGKLLDLAEGKFDVLLTLDTGILYQNDLSDRSIAVITLISKKVRMEDLMPLVPPLLNALDRIKPGQVLNIFGP